MAIFRPVARGFYGTNAGRLRRRRSGERRRAYLRDQNTQQEKINTHLNLPRLRACLKARRARPGVLPSASMIANAAPRAVLPITAAAPMVRRDAAMASMIVDHRPDGDRRAVAPFSVIANDGSDDRVVGRARPVHRMIDDRVVA